MKRVNRFCSVIVACGLATVFADVFAQAFPNRPVRVVNPAAPGGNSDVFFRLLQPKMTARGPVAEADLIAFLREEWEKIPQETVDRLVRSYEAKLRACKKARGGPFKS